MLCESIKNTLKEKGRYKSSSSKSPFVEKLDSMVSVNPNIDLILKEDPQYEGLEYKRPIDDFDRNIQPSPSSPKPSVVPDYYRKS